MSQDNNPAALEHHPARAKPWLVTQVIRGRRIVLGRFHTKEAAQAVVDRVNRPDW